MLPEKIYLIDHSARLINEWKIVFSDFKEVTPIEGDYFQQNADAIVSPANSFGIMDGGLDLAIRDTLGYQIESKVQERIREKYHGELPVGTAEILETNDGRWPYMVAAPTMRIPENISNSINVYLAFKAILNAIKIFNHSNGPIIKSMVCSGLGTGVGRVSPERCANQMRLAYNVMSSPSRLPSFGEIHKFHHKLQQF